MSVQVRRRREAAAFLNGFVGAQGELLVDTTNNRVQVHDGTTPGGWPAAKLADLPSSSSPLALAAGGTGASTASAALLALGAVGRTAVPDANYQALASDRLIAVTGLTAARTLTLPAAAAYPTGTTLTVVDESGACSATTTITVARAGSDTINGAGSAQIATAYGYLALESNGAAKWTVIDAPGTAAASGTATTAQLTNRNAVINGNFAFNQRGYASGTALAANAYAHDRFKAGANGCTYTFTQGVPDTTVNLTAGTLIQAVDAPNLYATSCWLTWTGSATARIWQSSASGSFAAGSPATVGGVAVNTLLVAGLTLGTVANIEFSTGTLGLVQFEAALPNAGPTRFERRHGELALCQRYYAFLPLSVGFWDAASSTRFWQVSCLGVQMRATPTVMLVSGGSGVTDPYTASYTIGSLAYVEASPTSIAISLTTSGGTAGRSGFPHVDVKIGVSAEL